MERDLAAEDRLAQKGAQLEAATLVETKGEDLSPEEGAMQLEARLTDL